MNAFRATRNSRTAARPPVAAARLRRAAAWIGVLLVAFAPLAADARGSDAEPPGQAAEDLPGAHERPRSADGRPRTGDRHAGESKGTPAFTLRRFSVANGAGRGSGGAFAVRATLGAVDADPLHPASGGAFTLTGGFLAAPDSAAPVGDAVFANGFEAPNR
jgi:hypothetical protein